MTISNFHSQLKQQILKTNCKFKGATVLLKLKLKMILIFLPKKQVERGDYPEEICKNLAEFHKCSWNYT